MNIQNPVQPYIRPRVQSGAGQYSGSRKKGGVVDSVVWKPVVKILLFFLVPVVAVNIFLGASIRDTDRSISVAENKKYELRLENFRLKEDRDFLRSTEQIERMAGEKLSLYKPKGQVVKYNTRKGTFSAVF
ncbi:hypothetical protein DGMP_06970 [Desulfomarina profundi]|uniref:Septum formation initiator n=1 Tax=Desulfomarina profundi TaxID=2772557 RepID=A0A8D5JGE7_9BACT|nr:hypothetical protein [Desulfomarina profundi]BCL60004.1 hypothetical protein DGMP_06970 [Desulfomarina profundi]